jgi:hypothetical protein
MAGLWRRSQGQNERNVPNCHAIAGAQAEFPVDFGEATF